MAHVYLIIVCIDMDMACGKQWQVVVCIYKETNALLAFLFVVDSCLLLVLLDHKKWDKNKKPRGTNTKRYSGSPFIIRPFTQIVDSIVDMFSFPFCMTISVWSGRPVSPIWYAWSNKMNEEKIQNYLSSHLLAYTMPCMSYDRFDVRSICSKNDEHSLSVVCFILNFMKKKIRNNINIQSVRWM